MSSYKLEFKRQLFLCLTAWAPWVRVLLPLETRTKQGLLEFDVFVTVELLFLMTLERDQGKAPAYFVSVSVLQASTPAGKTLAYYSCSEAPLKAQVI